MSAVQAINHFSQKASPFSDWYLANTVATTTMTQASVLNQLAVQFAATLQITKPITWGGGNVRYQAAVQLHGVVVRIRTIGAQGTSLLYGDLYNSLRLILYISGSTLIDNPDSLGGGVDTNFNPLDVSRLLMDHLFDLPSTAFDSASGYNCPNVKSQYVYIPINQRFDFFSTNSSGSVWDTRKNNLVLAYVSDSSATPHPQFDCHIRMYYDMIQ